MAKTSGDFEKEFLETIQEKTGKTLAEWIKYLAKTGIDKQKALVDYLKKDEGLNHLQATLLAGVYLNGGNPVYMQEDNLLDNQFVKCADMKPLYEAFTKKLVSLFPDTQVIPKKTYISYTPKREFAAINVKPGEIRLGMDLGDIPFAGRLQKSKLSGPMPRISHMVVINALDDFDMEVENWLKASYSRVN